MSNLLEHGKDGRTKTTFSIFGVCLLAFICSWFIIFGIGGAIGVAIGISIGVISLILTIASGIASAGLYISWLEDKGY